MKFFIVGHSYYPQVVLWYLWDSMMVTIDVSVVEGLI